MNQQYSEQVIRQSIAGKNICYTFSGEEVLSRTRYKMMQGMLSSGLLPCILYRYNGMPKLMYITHDMRPLSTFGELDEPTIFGIVRCVLRSAQTLLDAEFLNFDNVLCNMSLIFADPQRMECGFIFLPLNNAGDGMGREKFEKNLIGILRTFILSHASRPGPALVTIAAETAKPDMTVQQISRAVEMMDTAPKKSEVQAGMGTGYHLFLMGTDKDVSVSLAISKPEFIVGRSVNGVDGTISFNPAVSRRHCKFIQNGMDTYIEDMDSSHGTFVNDVRIRAGQPVPVKVGDRIRLANSTFVLQEG